MAPLERNLYHITPTGMEAYLANCFFTGLVDRPRLVHSHPCYELIFVERDDGLHFVINPPLYEHMAQDAPHDKVRSLLFSIRPDTDDEICDIFRRVSEPFETVDSFGGEERIMRLRQIVSDTKFGARAEAAAELRLLFIGLARVIHASCEMTAPAPHQTLDEERIARLNDFFYMRLCDPNCSKAALADEIGVGERQLSRILNEVYGKGFGAILLEMRMTVVQAMCAQGRSIEEIMEATGYVTRATFKRAYKNYFGYPFGKN